MNFNILRNIPRKFALYSVVKPILKVERLHERRQSFCLNMSC